MKTALLVAGIFMLLFSSAALADGNLTATVGSLTISYANTKQSHVMVNITLNATATQWNVTAILINRTGDATTGNISAVIVYNDSDNDGAIGASDVILGTRIAWDNENQTRVNFTSGGAIYNLSVFPNSQKYLLIVYNISANASRFNKTGINITSNASIIVAVEGGTNANMTIPTTTINSSVAQIQDVRANITLNPHWVDTSVVNQTFVFNISVTGADQVNTTRIVMPGSYLAVNLTNVTLNGNTRSIAVGDSGCGSDVCYRVESSAINVSYATFLKIYDNVTLRFTVNTSASAVSANTLNITLIGSNISSGIADAFEQANITTQQMVVVQNIRAMKSTALPNGTDYWEFNFTLNVTANVTGLLQFRMSNWNNSAGQIVNLTNQTDYVNATFYATLRETGTSTNYFNVTNNYDLTKGVLFTIVTTSNPVYAVLRMIVPSGTPISASWWTQYWMLFRPIP